MHGTAPGLLLLAAGPRVPVVRRGKSVTVVSTKGSAVMSVNSIVGGRGSSLLLVGVLKVTAIWVMLWVVVGPIGHAGVRRGPVGGSYSRGGTTHLAAVG